MEGRRLIALALLASIAVVGGVLGVHGTDADAWRTAARATARVSLAWFFLVAAASSIRRLWPGNAGRWMMKNRRMLGLSFAVAHGIHAAAFLQYARVHVESLTMLVSPATLYGGGLGYLFIAAMAATSTNTAVKRLGRTRWNALHKVGIHVVLVVFAATYIPRGFGGHPWAVVGSVALVSLLALRTAAWRRRRRDASKADPP